MRNIPKMILIFVSIFILMLFQNSSHALMLQSPEFDYQKPNPEEIDQIRKYVPDNIDLVEDKLLIMIIYSQYYGIDITYKFIRFENYCSRHLRCLNLIIGGENGNIYHSNMILLGPYVSLAIIDEDHSCELCFGEGKMIFFRATRSELDRAVRLTNFGLIF